MFDYSDSEFWKTNLLIKVNIDDGLHVDYIPIVKAGNGVHLVKAQVTEVMLTAFRKRSDEILLKDFVEQQYRKFAQKNIDSYLRKFSGFGKWLSRIDRYLFKGILAKSKCNKRQLLTIQNFIECEAHRELVIKGLLLIQKRK